jgi:hypothetical protein
MKHSIQYGHHQLQMKEKQLQIEECFSYPGSLVTSDAICKRGIKSGIAMVNAELKKETFFFPH